MTVRLFIDGGHGTTGLEIHARLSGRSGLEFITLDDDQRKDDVARRDALNSADFAILCLPDDAARSAVAMIGGETRVIDASSAHRVENSWIYGFPELEPGQRQAIANAQFITNPGCYPTGFLALIAPLVRAGLIDRATPLTVNAVSGYSGGGKALIERFEGDSDIAYRAYGLSLDHKHVREMQIHAHLDYPPLFAPAVVPGYRGMLVEVPLNCPASPLGIDAVQSIYQDRYADEKLINLVGAAESELLMHRNAPANDTLEIRLFASPDGHQLRLIASLDNLGKGAAGAAIQNFNLMAGFDEFEGLRV